MHINFHGAARHVTGSKHLITLNDDTSILLDCGMFQGMGDKTEDLNSHLGFNPAKVDYVLLSHAHIDHCGLLPKMVAEGFTGHIFCTPATMELARILLTDSAKIQQQDAEYSNKHRQRHDQPQVTALYNEEWVISTMSLFKAVDYHTEYVIRPDIKFLFTDAGHIMGSAAIHLTIVEDNKPVQITFSGDVGRYGDLLLRNPQTFPQADYILIESTYGDSLHQYLAPIEEELYKVIQHTCINKQGKVIIPAFSVGRTQELLYALNALELKEKLPDVNYYVDSPLSIQATELLKSHPEIYNQGVKQVMVTDADPFGFKGLHFIQSAAESIALNSDPRPCVIISSSGMAEAGRVRHHIKNNIGNARNTILLVGYSEPTSLGGRLMRGDTEVYIFGEPYQVNAEVRVIKSMSAHGDYEDLLHFLSCQHPEQVKCIFLVHGEYETQQHFAQKLEAANFRQVEIPYQHQRVEL